MAHSKLSTGRFPESKVLAKVSVRRGRRRRKEEGEEVVVEVGIDHEGVCGSWNVQEIAEYAMTKKVPEHWKRVKGT